MTEKNEFKSTAEKILTTDKTHENSCFHRFLIKQIFFFSLAHIFAGFESNLEGGTLQNKVLLL